MKIDEDDNVGLTVRDREAYCTAVLNPPPPNKRLLAAAERYARSIKETLRNVEDGAA